MITYLNTPIFGIAITIIVYSIFQLVSNKLKLSIFNPIALSILVIILLLQRYNIDFETYNKGGSIISFFLGPATVALAVPLYKKLDLLKKNFLPIIFGTLVGSITAIISVILLGKFFKLDRVLFLSLIPKSTTSAIAADIATEIGGSSAIAIVFVIATGILGNIIAPGILKVFKINNKVAKGIAIGTSSHVGGTAKAVELGEVEGGMSSLAIGVAGLMTVVLVPLILKIMNVI